jgi:hypothetical protein
VNGSIGGSDGDAPPTNRPLSSTTVRLVKFHQWLLVVNVLTGILTISKNVTEFNCVNDSKNFLTAFLCVKTA